MKSDFETTEVSTRDLVRALRACSQFFKNNSVGKPAMGIAILSLAQAMQPLAGHPLQEVLTNIRLLPRSIASKKPLASLLDDRDLSDLSFEEIEHLLASGQLSKKDIIRLGHERLGLTEARLRREPISVAIESIRATMRNRDAMRMMEEESRRVALKRTT